MKIVVLTKMQLLNVVYLLCHCCVTQPVVPVNVDTSALTEEFMSKNDGRVVSVVVSTVQCVTLTTVGYYCTTVCYSSTISTVYPHGYGTSLAL